MGSHSFFRAFALVLTLFVFAGCVEKKEEKLSKSSFSIKITSHLDLQYSDSAIINLAGVYTVEEGINPDAISIRSKDQLATNTTDGSFEFTNYPLKMGKNKIDVKLVIDDEVKAQTSIWIVYSDFYIEILSPTDGQVFREDTKDINGIYAYPEGVDPKDLSINIDSHLDAEVHSDGTFSYKNYKLKKGTHKLTAKLHHKHKEKFRDINEVKYYEENQTPKAKFFVDPMEGKSPLKVSIDASESSDEDGVISKYLWSLGEGTQLETTVPILKHTYKWVVRGCNGETKDVTITLQVIDNDGGVSKTHQKVIELECEPNSPPEVAEDQVFNGQEDQILNFNITPATDVDGDPITYYLVSGPNVGRLNNCLNGTTSTQCEYIPLANYFGTVTFTYKANDGLYDSDDYATVTIQLAPVNDIPEMRGNQKFLTNEDTPVEFTLSGATDIDGDILKYRLATPPQGGTLQGCIQSDGDLSCRFVPDSNYFGKVTFSYIANDGNVDASSPAVVEIDVQPVNDYPIMLGDQTFEGTEDEIIAFNLSGAIDVEQQPLLYSLVSQPANGTLRNCLNSTGDLSCEFVPNKDFNGIVAFTYKANDGISDSAQVATVSVSFAAVNDRPVIGDDQNLEINEDGTLNFALNASTDVDEDSLAYRLISPPAVGSLTGCANGTGSLNCQFVPSQDFNGEVSFTYAVSDGQVDALRQARVVINVISINDEPKVGADQVLATSEDISFDFSLSLGTDVENDTLTYTIVSPPASGTLVGCGDGSESRQCRYVPARDFNGAVSFAYKVNDGQSDSATTAKVTINIAPVNDAPMMGQDQDIEGTEDTSLSFFLNQATDVDGDLLNYEIVQGPESGTLLNCLGGTSNLWCTFIPEENFHGDVEFTFRARDLLVASETVAKVTLHIQSVNDSPTMPDDFSVETNEDTNLAIDLPAAQDIEGDIRTYDIAQGPENGTLSGCLNGTADLNCELIPNKDFNGQVSFTYKANDGLVDSVRTTTVTINVLPVNDAPVMGEDQDFEINENNTLSLTINPAFDVEGDQLTYKVIIPPNAGVLSECLENNNDLSCVYTPPQNFSGEVTFRYRANDGVASTEKLGTVTIKVLMVNSAPVMAANTTIETNEDELLEFAVPAATDSDNDSLTYTITKQPSVGTISDCLNADADLSCRFLPSENFNGLVSFSYKANDGRLDAPNETEITFNVLPVNDAPAVGEDQALALNENSELKFSLSLGRDVDGDALTYSIVSAPQHGQIVGCADGTASTDCHFVPAADYRGTDSFTYMVNDGNLDSVKVGTVSFTINKINKAPALAQAPAYETNEDVAVILNLPAASDIDADPLKYWIGMSPANGKLENCLNGSENLSCSFTPKKDFNGEVSFSYFAFDGALKSGPSLVKVNVRPVNDPPVVGENQEFIFNEDEPFSFTINKSSDVDDEESLITYSITSPPTKGTLSNCLNFTNDLTCDYTSEKDFSGEVSFTYTASDGNSFSLEVGKVVLNIRPVNDSPAFIEKQLAEVNGGQTSNIELVAAIDPDGDQLTYELVSDPNNGTLTGCLGGTSHLSCEFTPSLGFFGTTNFTIRAFDGKSYSDTQTVEVSVLSPSVYPVQIAGGEAHTCSVMNNGDLYCWGNNGYGQLGYGNTQIVGDDELPASVGKVPVGGKVKKVVAGWFHTCALLESDDVKCWGYNPQGQLGQGNTIYIGDNELPSSIPVISLGAKAKDIEAGARHTCVILDSGDVKCWGYNNFGTLGLSRTDYSVGTNVKPVDVANVNIGSSVKQLAAGYEHTCALLDSGDIKCWGNNARTYTNCYSSCYRCGWFSTCCSNYCYNNTDLWGALGIGQATIIGDNEHPSSVDNVDIGGKAISIAASERGTCAVLENNQLRCWGRNLSGELGYGNYNIVGVYDKPTAINPIDVGFDVAKISLNRRVSCAVSTTNEIKCWGDGIYGGLGHGVQEVIGDNELPSSIGAINLGEDVKHVSTNTFSVCAILESNKIKCWGLNNLGQLGLGHNLNIGDNELPTSSGETTVSGSFPIAAIDFEESTYRAPVSIIFNGLASTPSEATGSIVKYEWNYGDSGTDEAPVTNHTFTKGGTYQVRLIVTDDLGLTSVARRNITILPEPMPTAAITASAYSGNVSLKVLFNGSWSTPSEPSESILSYEWDTGDGHTYSGISPEHVYSQAGVYTVKLTVADSKNRKNTAIRTVAAFDSLPPVAKIAYSPEELRAPVEVAFDASTSAPGSFDGSIVKYEWAFGDQTTGTGQTATHLYSQGGTYNVILTVTDDRGKTNSTASTVVVLPEFKPTAVIAYDVNSGYRPLTVNFDASDSTPTYSNGSIQSFKWYVNEAEVSSSEVFTHAFAEQGIFTVKLVVQDDAGKSALATTQITVQPKTPPVAQFAVISETIYPHVPFDISLDASASTPGDGGGSITNYTWSMGDGTTKTGPTATHRFIRPGTYQIQLMVENSDGEKSTKTITKTFYDSLMINVGTNYSAIFEGNWTQFKSNVRDHEGKIVSYPVQWASSDPSVLAIRSDGWAEGKAEGEAIITATVANNVSSVFKYEVKKRRAVPTLMVDSRYFLKSYEESILGGAFGLSSTPYVTSEFSTYLKSLVDGSGYFARPFSLLPGFTDVNITSYSGSVAAGQATVHLRFFDGHGKALSFDGLDDQAVFDISEIDTASDKLDLALWVRLSDVSVAGKILDIADVNGNGIKFDFDYKKTPVLYVESEDYPIFASGNELKPNEWTHFVISIDNLSKTVRLVQNGSVVAEKKFFSNLLWKGKALSGVVAGETFKGLIDDIKLFDMNLDSDQISSLMFAGKVTGFSPKASFSFDSEASQRYMGNLSSVLTLGVGDGYDSEDPALRFASTILSSKRLTVNGGGVLTTTQSGNDLNPLSQLSFEVPPFALSKDTDTTIELLDAKTSGFLPKVFKAKEYLLRIHPVNGENLKNPGVLTLPLNTESLQKYGAINLYRYEKTSGVVSRKAPINVNMNEQIVTFPINSFGTYFSSYDSTLYPEIEYSDSRISDGAFTGQFDRRFDALFKVTGSGPFNFQIQGTASDSTITYTTCDRGNITHNSGAFPLQLSGIPLGDTWCQVYFRKAIDEKNYLNISHLIYLSVKN